jgi:hypothetical protein
LTDIEYCSNNQHQFAGGFLVAMPGRNAGDGKRRIEYKAGDKS